MRHQSLRTAAHRRAPASPTQLVMVVRGARPGPHWNPWPQHRMTVEEELKTFKQFIGNQVMMDTFGFEAKDVRQLKKLSDAMQKAAKASKDWDKAAPLWKKAYKEWMTFFKMKPNSTFMMEFEGLRHFMMQTGTIHAAVRQADEEPDRMDMQHHGHDYTDYGANPLAPRPMLSEPPPGEPKSEQHGDLVLVVKHKGRALVVDPRQHYLVITMTGKDWWEGPRKDIGAVGREKALRALDKR